MIYSINVNIAENYTLILFENLQIRYIEKIKHYQIDVLDNSPFIKCVYTSPREFFIYTDLGSCHIIASPENNIYITLIPDHLSGNDITKIIEYMNDKGIVFNMDSIVTRTFKKNLTLNNYLNLGFAFYFTNDIFSPGY